MNVTISGNDYKASKPEQGALGARSVSNFEKVLDPYPIVRDNVKLREYTDFRLYGYAGSPSSKPKGPDQPYYAFNKGSSRLGLIGAYDGKSY